MIAARTRDALARARARGVTLRGPELVEARKLAAEAVRAEAERHATNVLPLIRDIQRAGATEPSGHRGGIERTRRAYSTWRALTGANGGEHAREGMIACMVFAKELIVMTDAFAVGVTTEVEIDGERARSLYIAVTGSLQSAI